MDCRGFWFDRYFRNVPPRQLMIYSIIVVLLLVTTILLMVPSSENDEIQPTPEPSGSNILKTVPLVDGYNALPVELMNRLKGAVSSFPFNVDTSTDETRSWCKSDIPRLQNGMIGTQIFTVKPSCNAQYKDSVSKTVQQIDALSRLLAMYPNDIKKISSSNDVWKIKEEGKLGVVIGLDGGHSIDNKLATLRTYHDLGVRYLTLNSECSTPWSTSYASKESEDKTIGLTEFGKRIVEEINRVGMIIDLSRSSKKTQLAVLDVTEAPVIFTATAAYNITPVAGNVEDEVLERVKKNNGLIMITFDAKLLSQSTNLSAITLKSIISHINYIRRVVGVDNVGLAAGFHKDNNVPITSLSDSSKYPILFDRLRRALKGEQRWTSDDLKKLAGLNFIRVWKSVEEIGEKKSAEEIPNDSLINPEDIPTSAKVCYSDP